MLYLGVLLILISSLCFVLSIYFGKIVTTTTSMTAVVTSFSRLLIGAIIMAIYMVATKKTFKSKDFKPVASRAFLNSFSIILSSWAIKYTTITNANMLHMTYPVFVILLAPFITKEKNNKSNYIYLFIIMLGSYIVSNPSFSNINVGDAASIGSAIFSALSIFALTMARKNNEGYLIVFYVMFIGIFINFPFAYRDLSTFDSNGIVPVLLSAFSGFFGQVFLTWGYKYVDSATGSLLSTSRIFMATGIGVLFLSEPINTRIIIGMILISLTLIGLSGYFDKYKNKTDII